MTSAFVDCPVAEHRLQTGRVSTRNTQNVHTGAKESSSSKKTTHGCARRARMNTSRMFFSLSPMYMLISSGPLTPRNLSAGDCKCPIQEISGRRIAQAFLQPSSISTVNGWRRELLAGPHLRPHSVATALARRVFPVPGGPYRRAPERLWPPFVKRARCLAEGEDQPGSRDQRTKTGGNQQKRQTASVSSHRNGSSIVSMMIRFASSSPPTSSHFTVGICAGRDVRFRQKHTRRERHVFDGTR